MAGVRFVGVREDAVPHLDGAVLEEDFDLALLREGFGHREGHLAQCGLRDIAGGDEDFLAELPREDAKVAARLGGPDIVYERLGEEDRLDFADFLRELRDGPPVAGRAGTGWQAPCEVSPPPYWCQPFLWRPSGSAEKRRCRRP